MIKKILRKLHMGPLAYSIENIFIRKITPPQHSNAIEAIAYLNGLSPDSYGSSVCEHQFAATDCDLEIIVPCYNVEQYVAECIESILSQQTRFSFFLTLINDGSKDSTGEVLKQYEGRANVCIITQENRGLSGARNTGIAQAHGRYLLFVDSDDLLLPGTVEGLMAVAERTDADVVDSGHIRFADRKKIKTLGARLRANIYDRLQKPEALLDNENSPWVTGYPCGKVLQRELFHKVKFPEGYWFEDTLVWMLLEPQCKRKVTTSIITFRYRMNPDSISHVSSGRLKSIDTLYVTLQLLKDREALGIEFDQRQYDMLLQQMRNNFGRVMSLPEKIQMAVFVVESNLIKQHFCTWNTDNPHVRPLQEMLRNGDFAHFRLWCKWH